MYYCIMIGIILLLVLVIIRYRKNLKLEEIRQEALFKIITKKSEELQKYKNEIESYEYFREALRIFHFDKAVDIVKNKYDHLYLVMGNTTNNKLDYLLAGKTHKGLMNCPRIYAEIKEEDNEKYIWINDIFGEDENCGNGTLLLNCIVKEAKRIGIYKIRGELAPSDVEKFDKLEHFYKKNGFRVTFNKEKTRGGIIRILEEKESI